MDLIYIPHGKTIEDIETYFSIGLPRQCPECDLVAHYELYTKTPQIVCCPDCDTEFTIQKFKRNQRPT